MPKLYGKIVTTTLLSLLISTVVLTIATFNLWMLTNFLWLIYLVPALLIGYVVYILVKRKTKREISSKNTNVVCVIVVAIVVLMSAFSYILFRFPDEIINEWTCEQNEILCVNGTCCTINISYDGTVGRHDGFFIGPNLTFKERIKFLWHYDTLSNEITLSDFGYWFINNGTKQTTWEWEVKLRLEVTSPGEMTTYYVSSKNAPFDAELLDGITWTAKKK